MKAIRAATKPVHFATLVNPREGTEVTAWMLVRPYPHAQSPDTEVHVECRVGGELVGWADGVPRVGTRAGQHPMRNYLRIHSDTAWGWTGRGYGMVLYLATALAAAHLGMRGVNSDAARSDDADRHWERLLQYAVARRVWTKTPSPYGFSRERLNVYDVLDAGTARATGFVIWERKP